MSLLHGIIFIYCTYNILMTAPWHPMRVLGIITQNGLHLLLCKLSGICNTRTKINSIADSNWALIECQWHSVSFIFPSDQGF